MMPYPVSMDPEEQRRADEAAGKAVSWLLGMGGVIGGLVAVLMGHGWLGIGLEASSIALLGSVVWWNHSKRLLFLWLYVPALLAYMGFCGALVI